MSPGCPAHPAHLDKPTNRALIEPLYWDTVNAEPKADGTSIVTAHITDQTTTRGTVMENGKGYVNGFFRWVWRINGLLLLALVLYGTANIIGRLVSFRHYAQVPNGEATLGRLGQPNQHQAALKLGSFEALPGTSVLYARLGSDGAPIGGLSSSYTPTDVHNLLFFDTTSRQAHWLFDENAQTITAMSVISESTPAQAQGAKPDCQALGLLFLSRPAQADSRDNTSWDIGLASIDGHQLKTLATGIDTLLGHRLTDNHTLLVFYAKQGAAHVLDVDLATREVRSDKVLAAKN